MPIPVVQLGTGNVGVHALRALITNPDYAREVGITPTLSPDQLRGVVLNCGVYDVRKIVGGKPVRSPYNGEM